MITVTITATTSKEMATQIDEVLRKWGTTTEETTTTRAQLDDEGEELEEDDTDTDDVAALSLEADVVPALQAYMKRHGGGAEGKKAAQKILAKFGAKTSKDLDEDDYEKVIKACK